MTDEVTFEPGDVVVLKSFSPKMTVTQVRADGHIECTWFPNEGRPEEAIFPASSLRKPQ